MKVKNFMKKLSALALGLGMTLGVVSGAESKAHQVDAAEDPYKEMVFSGTYRTKKTNSYTDTANFTNGSFEIDAVNFNTSNDSWNCIKCGRKNNASVAYILNTTAIDKAITKIDIVFGTSSNLGKINESYIIASNDLSSFDSTKKHAFEVASESKVSVSIDDNIANGYYKVVFDCASNTSNGFIEVDAIKYYASASAHTHTYSTSWSSDDDYHWHAATCEHTSEVSEKAAHTWNAGVVTTQPTCTEEGVKTFTCTECNKTKTEPVDALGHDYIYTPIEGGEKHSVTCSRCDYSDQCDHHFGDPTYDEENNNLIYTCSDCSFKKYEPFVLEVISIEVTKQPNKTSYILGEDLELDGLVVNANWTNGNSTPLTLGSDFTVTGFDKYSAGEQTLTVTYLSDETLTDEIDVTVSIFTPQSSTTYSLVTKAGDIVNGDIVIIAQAEDKSDREGVTGYTSGSDANVSTNSAEWAYFTVSNVSGLNYSLSNGGKYITNNASNKFSMSSTQSLMTIDTEEGRLSYVDGSNDTRYLYHQGTFIRCYKYNANYESGAFYVFKKVTNTSSEGVKLINLQVVYSHSGNTYYAGDEISTSDLTVTALRNTSAEYSSFTDYSIQKYVNSTWTNSSLLSVGSNKFRVVANSDDSITAEFEVNSIEERTASVKSVYLSGTPTVKDYYYDGVNELQWDYSGLQIKVAWDDDVTIDTYQLGDLVESGEATISPENPTVNDNDGHAVSFAVSYTTGGVSINTENYANVVSGLTCQNREIDSISWQNRFKNVTRDVFAGTKVKIDQFGTVSATYNNGESVKDFSIDNCEIWLVSDENEKQVTFTNNEYALVAADSGMHFQLRAGNVSSENTDYDVFTVTPALNDIEKVTEGQAGGTGSFDFTAQSYSNQAEVSSFTIGQVTGSLSKGDNSNGPKYYTTGTAVRVYAKNKITVSVPNNTITAISFTWGSGGDNNEVTASTGVFDGISWTGSATSVTFTVGGSSGNVRLQAISVTYGGADAIENIANKDITAQKAALAFADLILECEELDSTEFASLASSYSLTGIAADLLKWATPNANGDNIQKAVYAYDAYTKSNNPSNNFLGRPIEHDAELVEAKEATCTEAGNFAHYHCDLCNKNFEDEDCTKELVSVTIAAKGHSLEEVAANAATCTGNGNVKYWHCTTCGKNFSDEQGTSELTDVVVSALGHDMHVVEATEPTLNNPGIAEHKECSRCDRIEDMEGNVVTLESLYVYMNTEIADDVEKLITDTGSAELPIEGATANIPNIAVENGKAMVTPTTVSGASNVLFSLKPEAGKVLNTVTVDVDGKYSVFYKTSENGEWIPVEKEESFGPVLKTMAAHEAEGAKTITLPEGALEVQVRSTGTDAVELRALQSTVVNYLSSVQTESSLGYLSYDYVEDNGVSITEITGAKIKYTMNVEKGVYENAYSGKNYQFGFMIGEGKLDFDDLVGENYTDYKARNNYKGIIKSAMTEKEDSYYLGVNYAVSNYTTDYSAVFFIADSEGNILEIAKVETVQFADVCANESVDGLFGDQLAAIQYVASMK